MTIKLKGCILKEIQEGMKGLGGVRWFLGTSTLLFIWSKKTQLFASKALLLWKCRILPELGPGSADINVSSPEVFHSCGGFYLPGSHVHYQ